MPIRDFVGRQNTSWNDITGMATFEMNGQTLSVAGAGGVVSGVNIWNDNGHMTANITDLQRFFRVGVSDFTNMGTGGTAGGSRIPPPPSHREQAQASYDLTREMLNNRGAMLYGWMNLIVDGMHNVVGSAAISGALAANRPPAGWTRGTQQQQGREAHHVITRTVPAGRQIVGTNFNEIMPTQDWINMSVVNQYANRLRSGERLPAIHIHNVPGRGAYIHDGHHRFAASQLTGIPVDVHITTGPGPTGFPNWSFVEPTGR